MSECTPSDPFPPERLHLLKYPSSRDNVTSQWPLVEVYELVGDFSHSNRGHGLVAKVVERVVLF